MPSWQEAVSTAMSMASGKRVGRFPSLTNREASGLILFARQVMEYAVGQGHPVTFDWYAFALSALGWRKRGDVFDMSTAHQIANYPTSTELWSALEMMASQLDEAKVPFELVRDPGGTETTYKRIAEDAWQHMQRESPLDAQASTATANANKGNGGKSKPAASSTSTPATSRAVAPVPAGAARDRGERSSNGGDLGTIALIGLVALAIFADD